MKAVKVKLGHNKRPCCVKNYHNNYQENSMELGFHVLPKNRIVRAQWIKKLLATPDEFALQSKNPALDLLIHGP